MLSAKSIKARELFGNFITNRRLEENFTVYNLGYIMDISPVSPNTWERGICLPKNIVVYQKLKLIFPDVSDFMKNMFLSREVEMTKREKKTIDNIIAGSEERHTKGKLSCSYKHNDRRMNNCVKNFGISIRKKRLDLGISGVDMSNALGLCSSGNLCRWESGATFPRDIENINKLDYILGGVFDMVFGMCQESNVKISKTEVKKVLGRIKEVQSTRRTAFKHGVKKEKENEKR